ncbi:MAG: ribonuclease P protein component, partial [Prevotella sp.]|nr:ribonuclease P protein component [Prevotella sp.]
MTSSQQLPKSERINSKKLIDRLFKGGGAKSMSAFPLRVVFMTEDGDAHEPFAQMMVSVPKRFFKRAVKRNLVKRLVREAYRRNKQVLIDTLQTVEQRKTLSL